LGRGVKRKAFTNARQPKPIAFATIQGIQKKLHRQEKREKSPAPGKKRVRPETRQKGVHGERKKRVGPFDWFQTVGQHLYHKKKLGRRRMSPMRKS